LAWSWRLSEATAKQRAKWEIIGDGHGVHWPDIDEDISAEGMLYGIPAPRPRTPSKSSLKTRKKTTAYQRIIAGRHQMREIFIEALCVAGGTAWS
jgi:hypothetical protein